MAASYFVLIREMRDPYNHRLRLVESARQRGLKPHPGGYDVPNYPYG